MDPHTNVFENRLLRICGPKREEVAGGWRILHNEELHNLYASPNIIRVIESRKMRWAGHVAPMGDMRNAYNTLVGKSEVERLFRRPRHRWEDNIRMGIREIGWEVVDLMLLAQDKDQWRTHVNTVMDLRFLLKTGNFLTS
jgi:hypothetical protein